MRNGLDGIKLSWPREVLGARAARNCEFGEVGTGAGNGHGRKKGRTVRRGGQLVVLTGLVRYLEGIFLP